MINGSTILTIIPARAGSKRLPGKNTKLLANKPLIQWSIDAALNCDLLDCTMVTTDDHDIANLATKSGVDVPFLRPESLAQDNSTTIDVILHTVKYYQQKGKVFDYVLLLQPTSPLRSGIHITEAINMLNDKNADAVVSVCSCEHSPLWSNTLDESCSMDSFLSNELKETRSQDLPVYFRLNGAIYLVKTERLLKERTMFISDNIYAYKMNVKNSIDIDEEIDFLLAEAILKSEK